MITVGRLTHRTAHQGPSYRMFNQSKFTKASLVYLVRYTYIIIFCSLSFAFGPIFIFSKTQKMPPVFGITTLQRDPCRFLQNSQHFHYFFLGFEDHTFGERFLLRTLTWAKYCTGNNHISPSSYSNLINLNTPKSTDCGNSEIVKELRYQWT